MGPKYNVCSPYKAARRNAEMVFVKSCGNCDAPLAFYRI